MSSGADSLRRRLDAWLDADPDPVTRVELQRLIDHGRWDELAARFDGRLTFGTAGLRAELGAGPLRMNRLVVRQAAAGLLGYLEGQAEFGPGPARRLRLVVGHDARHRSADFAGDTAGVAAAEGVDVHRFERPVPTPVLAFAVRHLHADAGVMVTASHNPPADNGYKVYLGDGAQLVPPHDERIAAAIDAVAGHDKGRVRVADPPPALPSEEVVDAYLAATVGALASPAHRDVRVAYTPLSGVGLDVARRAFERAGFPPLDVVTSQAQPDPNFGGLAFPNPEEPGVLDAVLALARESGADVALANDPDADRLGVAVPDPDRGGWRPLSGNEIGALLADHLLRHSAGADRLVVASLVSSRLVERLARAAGVHFEATLTGFKWIVRPALAHPEWRFLFGYEEALGFSVSPVVRDKDGIAAALAFAELTAELRAQGSSPVARLVELARAHGLHATRQWSIRFADRHQGLHQASALMERVRRGPPPLLGGQRLATIRDLLAPGSHLPPTDAVLWDLDDGSRIVFRPSGTEPKLKVYLEVVRPVPAGDRTGEAVRHQADAALDTLQGELASLLEVPRWADETGHGSRG